MKADDADHSAENDPLKTRSGDSLLATALETPGDKLSAILQNGRLSEEQLLAILRRRDLSGEFIADVSRDQRWAARYLIKQVIVMNAHTPRPVSMNLVKFLFWRDLVKVIDNYAIPKTGVEPRFLVG